MRLPRRIWALGLVALVGCATGAPFICPARGGPPWRDVASEHFVLRTDLDLEDARQLLVALERLRTAVISALFDELPASQTGVEVVAFRSEAAYRAFAPPRVDAYYLRSAGGPPRIVLAGRLDRRQKAMLAHEMTHHYLSSIFLRQPRWFSEGLATLMESVGDQGDGPLLTVGTAPPARSIRLNRETSKVPTRELLVWDGSATAAHPALDYYSASWLLAHYLSFRQPERFVDLQRRLVQGESPEAAWRGAFPDWDPARPRALEALDLVLEAYLGGEAQTRFRQVRETWRGEPLVRFIPPAEVHAMRLALWNQGPDKGVTALRMEVTEALEEDADHPLALQFKATLTGEPALPLARRAVASHADDPRAWTFLAGALKGEPHNAERLVAYQTAARLADGNAAALFNYSTELLAQGRSGEALPVAREAARLAPWSPPVLDGYAAVLVDLGACAQALDVQRRALEVLSERAPEPARQALRDRLQQILAQCRTDASPPASRPSGG
jgi:tetratricopeptide (TPR) repeat protein